MKKKLEGIEKNSEIGLGDKKMTRKEALKKSGYIAFTAASMMILLSNPTKAQAASPAAPSVW